MKFGAFNACPGCGATPESEEDYALSLAMTEHYFPKPELEKMAGQVAKGEKLYIDPEVKWRFIQLLRAEGVGRQTEASQPFVPGEALDLFPEEPVAKPRRWWRFWEH